MLTIEDLTRLHELQEIDSAIDERRTLLAEVDDGTDLLETLETAREKLEELEEELHQMRSRQRKLELDLEGIEDEKQEKTDRAYGGMVSDPKELAALEKKIQELGRNAERHEDMILELLEEIDDLEGRVAEQSQKVERLQSEHEAVVSNYEETTATTTDEIAELEAARAEIAAELPGSLVKSYEQLRERHGGIAVAVLRGTTCAVCNVAVPSSLRARVEEGNGVVRCESCRRILVAGEGGS